MHWSWLEHTLPLLPISNPSSLLLFSSFSFLDHLQIVTVPAYFNANHVSQILSQPCSRFPLLRQRWSQVSSKAFAEFHEIHRQSSKAAHEHSKPIALIWPSHSSMNTDSIYAFISQTLLLPIHYSSAMTVKEKPVTDY